MIGKEVPDADIPTKRLIYDEKAKTFVEAPTDREEKAVSRQKSRFVRTIPFLWATRACRLPGKAAQVCFAIWYLSGLKKSKIVRIPSKTQEMFGVARKPFYNAIAAMEEAGLISVARESGKPVTITILDVE